ncbi:type I polyketide synthase [Mycolicibacterium setense]
MTDRKSPHCLPSHSLPDNAIAVIGMSCRFPGAGSIQDFWRLLCDSERASTQIPSDRLNLKGFDSPGLSSDQQSALRKAAILDEIDGFDAAFFSISPREAAAMDPQQRIMLELAWTAFEDARLSPRSLAGTQTGVFIGAMRDGYAPSTDLTGVGAHTFAGSHRGMTANRVSFNLGLRGPSLVVDTGQSSSLVAIHLAVESLRRGESVLAVAGGIHLHLDPAFAVAAARLGALSPTGRCHVFDARADGFVRGEGGGVVVLKAVRDAVADGDRIYAVIRGSAVNNDGSTDGLTVPGVEGQAQLLRSAYKDAAVEPRQIQYVELHGTGTRRGDPVEAAALSTVIGGYRPRRDPLVTGSVKTNIGHLEAAAGIAGLIKTILATHHRRIPASLNHRNPHPEIPLGELGLRVRTRCGAWPSPKRPLIAGVSSFGMGGTNAHVVLEQSPTPATTPNTDTLTAHIHQPSMMWPISGHTSAALAKQAGQLHSHLLDHPSLDPAAIAHSLAATRAHQRYRAVISRTATAVWHTDHTPALESLAALAEGRSAPTVVHGVVPSSGPRRIVFVFPGQGSQYAGMATELYRYHPGFARSLDECDHALRPLTGWSVLDVLHDVQQAPSLRRDDVVQPTLFAVMIALANMWRSYGIVPDVVVGHSQGEIAAAHIAGALTLEDAARVITVRSRALSALAGTGAMASVLAPCGRVEQLLELCSGHVSIAAINGPDNTTVSGDTNAVEELLALCERNDVGARRIPVDYASHSSLIESIRDQLLRELTDIRPAESSTPLYCTVDGHLHEHPLDTTQMTGDYWYANLRHTVRFHDTVAALLKHGPQTFVEISPHPVLLPSITDIVAAAGSTSLTASSIAVESLRKNLHDLDAVAGSLAQFYCHGHTLDWQAITPPTTTVDLPTYAFQHSRYPLARLEPATPTPVATPTEPWDTAAANAGSQAIETTEAGSSSRTEQLSAMPPDQRAHELLDLVRSATATVLGHPEPNHLDLHTTFKELGVDSTTALELRRKIGHDTGLMLPTTLIFNNPTPRALSEHLCRQFDSAAAPVAPTAHTAPTDEPVAIVGMACRFPGNADSPHALWELVMGGIDAVANFPADRGWNLATVLGGDMPRGHTPQGAFLHDAAGFDASFFGISPREAISMDPQQRILLEICWEALELAGIDPHDLHQTKTGIFTGTWAQPYSNTDSGHCDDYALTGTATSVASGRVAYTLGLQGPAITVDTACSSSLVAIHLACQSLRSGESKIALAGGVTIMSTPIIFTQFANQHGLAPDGRCKSFSANADGTGWGEGAGMIVLERLSDAQAYGRRILAVIRSSAVNQDGASNGLTAPNGTAQEQVIHQALAKGGLTADQVDIVEAHGTGTRLGDPIEATALHATYGQGHSSENPLYLGSIKSNIGHTQAAAGVAGVIKMVQAIRHRVLPATLHAEMPTPHVDWSSGALRLLTTTQPWPNNEHPPTAAVSSFGISGTNAHVILQAPEAQTAVEEQPESAGLSDTDPDRCAPNTASTRPALVETSTVLIPVSAKSSAGLADYAQRLYEHCAAQPELVVSDVGYTLAIGRASFPHRAALLVRDRNELLAGLEALTQGRQAPHLTTGTAASGKTVYMFSGQGSQYPGMGASLYMNSPVFAEALNNVCSHLDPYLDRPLRDIMFAAPGTPEAQLLDQTGYTQPALFAIEVALYRLLEHLGLTCDAVVGHSVGEIAAAHIAGILTVQDAATLTALRGRLIQSLPGGGSMAALQGTEREVSQALSGLERHVSIAAINAPDSVVISGEPTSIDRIVAQWSANGRRATHLTVSHAFHSPQMDPILDDLRRAVRPLSFSSPRIALYSSVTGRLATLDQLQTPDYWADQARRTVRFEQAVQTLLHDGYHNFIEIGPHPALVPAVRSAVDAATEATPGAHVVTGTLRHQIDDTKAVFTALAEMHTHGITPDWRRVYPASRRVELPTYPFQHRTYWPTRPASGQLPAIATDMGTDEFWRAVDDKDLDALSKLTSADRAGLATVLPSLASWRHQRRTASAIEKWHYRVVWKPTAPMPRTLSGRWLLVHLPGQDCAAAQAALTTSQSAIQTLQLDPDIDRPALTRQLNNALAGNDYTGIVSLVSWDEDSHPSYPDLSRGLASTLTLTQALTDLGLQVPLWNVTTGAVSIADSDILSHPIQAQSWGLGLVAALEHPQLWGGLIDLPTHPTSRHWQLISSALMNSTREDQLAVRDSGIFARRLVRSPLSNTAKPWKPSGVVMVTGATGALGQHIIRWLANAGVDHIVMVSRSKDAVETTSELQDVLRRHHVDFTVATCDVSDRDSVSSLLDDLENKGTPVRSVIHAAGLIKSSALSELSLHELAEVLRGKVSGAVNVSELFAHRDLDALVFFSSGAGVWGMGTMAAYAAANAFLDAYATQRRSQGEPATSISWGTWESIGNTVAHSLLDRMRDEGNIPMDAGTALSALQYTAKGDLTCATVADIDWDTFLPIFTSRRASPLLQEMTTATSASPQQSEPEDNEITAASLHSELVAMSADERNDTLLALVTDTAAAVLQHGSGSEIPPQTPFKDIGFTSLSAVEFSKRLTAATGLRLTASLAFDHPTATDVANFIDSTLGSSTDNTPSLLDSLENSLRNSLLDEQKRAVITDRLNSILLSIRANDAAQSGPIDLTDASDEEVFRFLDSQLGSSKLLHPDDRSTP